LTLIVEDAQHGREVETGLAEGLNIGPLGGVLDWGDFVEAAVGAAPWRGGLPALPGTAGTIVAKSLSGSARHALPVWAEVDEQAASSRARARAFTAR